MISRPLVLSNSYSARGEIAGAVEIEAERLELELRERDVGLTAQLDAKHRRARRRAAPADEADRGCIHCAAATVSGQSVDVVDVLELARHAVDGPRIEHRAARQR